MRKQWISLLTICLGLGYVFTHYTQSAEKKGDSLGWPDPLFSIQIPDTVYLYLKDGKDIVAERAEILQKVKDKATQEKKLKANDKKIEEVRNKLGKLIEKLNSDVDSENKRLSRQLDTLSKQLDNANEASAANIQNKINEIEARLKELDELTACYDMFSVYLDSFFADKKENATKALASYPFGLIGKTIPSIKGMTMGNEAKDFDLTTVSAPVRIVVICAGAHPASVQMLEDCENLSRSFGGKVAVIGIAVDKDPSLSEKVLKKVTCPVIYDRGKTYAAAFKVRFLPQVMILDNANLVSNVYVGGSKGIINEIRNDVTTLLKTYDRSDKKFAK